METIVCAVCLPMLLSTSHCIDGVNAEDQTNDEDIKYEAKVMYYSLVKVSWHLPSCTAKILSLLYPVCISIAGKIDQKFTLKGI